MAFEKLMNRYSNMINDFREKVEKEVKSMNKKQMTEYPLMIFKQIHETLESSLNGEHYNYANGVA